MANIPTYQSQFDQQPLKGTGPALTANMPAMPVSSDGKSLVEAGQGLMNAGTALAAVVSRMRREQDQADAMDAMVQLHKASDEPIAELRNKKNGDAVGLVQSWDDAFPQIRDGISSKLSSGAKYHFDRMATSFYADNRRMFANQEADERQNYASTTAMSLAETKGQTALQNYTDGASFTQNVNEGVDALKEALRLKGIAADSPAGQQALAKFQSNLITERADRFVTNHQFGTAQQILAEGRKSGMLLGSDAVKIEGKLKEVQLMAGANDLAAKWVNLDPAQAFAASRNVGDPFLAQRALSIYHAQFSAQQQANHLAVQNGVVNGINTIDQYVKGGDFVGLQNYVDSLPKGSPSQLQVQQHLSTYAHQNIQAATGASGRFTQPAAYMGLLSDIGPGGSITSPTQLIADPRTQNIDVVDRNKLLEQLKGNTNVNEHELMNQFKLSLGYANGDDPQTKLSTDEKNDFMRFKEWATAMTKDSKMGKDPDYLKKLAVQWTLKGETKNWWVPFSYGLSSSFGDVIKKSPEDRASWLPSLPDVGTSDRQKLDMKFSQPGTIENLKRSYNTEDTDLAKRMYYRDLIFGKNPMMPTTPIGKGQ